MRAVKVTVHLRAGLEIYSHSNSKTEYVEITGSETVAWLIEYYGFPAGVIGVIAVNGNLTDKNKKLSHGDVVDFYPFFGGG